MKIAIKLCRNFFVTSTLAESLKSNLKKSLYFREMFCHSIVFRSSELISSHELFKANVNKIMNTYSGQQFFV